MGVVSPVRKVSATDLLTFRNEPWRDELRAVSLVAEALAPPKQCDVVMSAFARILGQHGHKHAKSQVLRRWPAAQVMATVSVTAEYSRAGTLWPLIEERVGESGQAFQKLWGDAFLANLDALNLPDFSDIDEPVLRYVGPAFLHAGVPTYCLEDYFRLITDRRNAVPGITPQAFVNWASARAAEGRLQDVDKPVQRFLRYGGAFAVDVTDRVFELLEIVSGGGTPDDVPLPSRFHDAAIRMSVERKLVRASARRDPETGGTAPRLILDAYGRGPILRLPAVDTSFGGPATWRVVAGNREDRLVTQALWPGEPAPEMDHPIVAPIRSVTTSLLGRDGLIHTTPVIDNRDPILVFGEDGEQLPSGLPLRGSTLWFLFHGDHSQLIVHGDHRVIAQGTLPPGWAGWSLLLVDVTGATAVQSAESSRAHRIRGMATVRIVAEDPVTGLTSASGAPVFKSPPRIVLPEKLEDVTWTVTITNHAHDVLVDRRPICAGDDPTSVWDALAHPLLGRYTVQVRGPWGRGASREIHIAENVTATSSPPWRRGDIHGLVPARVTLTTPTEMHLDAHTVTLAENETVRPITVQHGAAHTLLVRPPHMSMSYQSTERSTPPSIRPVPITSEELREDPGTLTISLQQQGEPLLHALAAHRIVQQIAPSGSSQGGLYRFDLRRLSETIATHPHLRLALDPSGTVAVATVTPRQLVSSIGRVGNRLVLHDYVEAEGLVTLVYLGLAPWRPPIRLYAVDGAVELPSEIANAGPLVAHVRVEDAWVPQPTPAWPPRPSAWIDRPGWPASDDPAEEQLSRFLAGEGEFPTEDADLTWVWTVASLLPVLRCLDTRFHDVAAACYGELRAHPVPALLALAEASVHPARVPEMLVRSGVSELPTALAARARADWTPTTAVAATLLTARRLAESVHSDADAEGLIEARLVCGDVTDALLTGTDPCPEAGRLDASAELYLRLDPDSRAEFQRKLQLLPKGLLDVDSRATATLQLLDGLRTDFPHLRNGAARSLREVEAMLHSMEDSQALALIAARKPPGSGRWWASLAALSIGWAWVARRAARGSAGARVWIATQRRSWIDLARLAPDLVTIDVIRAELLLAARDATVARQLDDTTEAAQQ